MGKILCDNTTWRDPPAPQTTSWDDVTGLEEQQRRSLTRLQWKGVLWKHPVDTSLPWVLFRLSHGGHVESDGNCLYTATERALGGVFTAAEMRRRTVRRFVDEFRKAETEARDAVEAGINNMYTPDLKFGWGIHLVQELKLLAVKSDRPVFDDAILQLLSLGMPRIPRRVC
ncbi:hypothetical protein vseg_002236 [Gypsophila vaccaria]